jgi:hypothetical protein
VGRCVPGLGVERELSQVVRTAYTRAASGLTLAKREVCHTLPAAYLEVASTSTVAMSAAPVVWLLALAIHYARPRVFDLSIGCTRPDVHGSLGREV